MKAREFAHPAKAGRDHTEWLNIADCPINLRLPQTMRPFGIPVQFYLKSRFLDGD